MLNEGKVEIRAPNTRTDGGHACCNKKLPNSQADNTNVNNYCILCLFMPQPEQSDRFFNFSQEKKLKRSKYCLL